MKIHTTNYKNAFIEVAEDCPAVEGEIPPVKGEAKTVANLQFEMLSKNPYTFTSDEVVFQTYAIKNDLAESELATAREKFFSKGQACLRTSPLAKRYGWGIHHNNEGKIALFGCETDQYEKFQKDKKLQVVKAMRSSRK
ncbi:hypothetical protein ABH942_001221 [Flavobacterium sp. 28YEA47A]|uniref:DUF6157 family protein n=1 Tax=Flavobacterium sp. 28YEA47A TaxID=3156276 RepID=UPI003513BEA6